MCIWSGNTVLKSVSNFALTRAFPLYGRRNHDVPKSSPRALFDLDIEGTRRHILSVRQEIT